MCAACTTTFYHGGALMPYGGNDWLALTQEPTLEPEMPICDPHHHFWDFRTARVPYQRYLLHELAADIHGGHNLRFTVFIQARAIYPADGPEAMRPLGEVEFEAWLYFPQLPELAAFAKAVPDLTIILDHIGGLLRVGPYANRDHEVLATWRRGIAAVAACPNVYVKLGGIGMPRTGFDWHTRSTPIGSDKLAAAMALSFAKTSAAGQVVDLSALILTQSRLNGHSPA